MKSLLSMMAVVISSTGLMAAYTVPMWKPADVLKNTTHSFAEDVLESSQENETKEKLNRLNGTDSSLGALQDAANPTTDAGKNIKTHRVRLSADGLVPGKITVTTNSGEPVDVENARVLLIKNGNIITESRTKANGTFQIKDAGVGDYSVFVVGANAFMAYGIEIVPPLSTSNIESSADTLNVSLVADDAELGIQSTAVPPRDFKMIYQIIDQYMPNLNKKANLNNSMGSSSGPVPDPASSMSAEALPDEVSDGKYEPDVTLTSNPVLLTGDGELVGRVRRYHPTTGQPLRIRQMQAFLINNGQRMVAPIREDGRFVFKNVQPGTYSFASAGLEGFSAFGVSLVSNPGSALASADIPRELVLELAMNLQGGGMGGGALSPPEDTATGVGEQQSEDNPDNSTTGDGGQGGNLSQNGNPNGDSGGGSGGGTGGGTGGGAGGGGGALGALLGAGGLAAGLAALADDDENPQSP
jgi:hypothetical protein